MVEPAALRADWSRDRVIAEIVARDVPCYAGSCSEIYRERAFEGESASSPTAGSVADRCIDLLCEQRHISGDVDPVADRIGLQRVGTDQAPHARHRRTKRTRWHPEAILDLRGPQGDARIDRQQGDQAALTRARQCVTHSADVDERDRTQHRHVGTRGIFRPTCSG